MHLRHNRLQKYQLPKHTHAHTFPTLDSQKPKETKQKSSLLQLSSSNSDRDRMLEQLPQRQRSPASCTSTASFSTVMWYCTVPGLPGLCPRNPPPPTHLHSSWLWKLRLIPSLAEYSVQAFPHPVKTRFLFSIIPRSWFRSNLTDWWLGLLKDKEGSVCSLNLLCLCWPSYPAFLNLSQILLTLFPPHPLSKHNDPAMGFSLFRHPYFIFTR